MLEQAYTRNLLFKAPQKASLAACLHFHVAKLTMVQMFSVGVFILQMITTKDANETNSAQPYKKWRKQCGKSY